ncbi:hypothetical protein K469DRAFT_652473 [Zopfia rhizophila CBS 207.26]|uniref:J domain-containing protein n=1 Tax=Zopfia rhizophila CBS 207.26 TaxID=1314779 RepID=A0A6A6ESR2_9PEZI|nr:hypothetical protein K469DRAFT_652473 [Zopfia rhizophila CBS 207.26]
MVKADPTRNYYADLEISANADENEVKKAFRKLALIYHPDRNPGREAKVVTKFQAIQAAHEVLSDPVQRLKYDNDRKKYRNLNIPPFNNSPRRPAPPPRNAYTTTTPSGSYYRAPPPRPPPPRPPPPQHHKTFANGADRFTSSNFRAPPTSQRPNARQSDAEARANVFTAWQKMKQPRGEEAHPYNPNGAPFGRSKSTRVPSKKGFDPATPGADEGQARSSYRSNYERPVPSPPQTADPLKHSRGQMDGDNSVPYAEGNRFRTPYSSTKGERMSMFGDGLGRSASVRNSPRSPPGSTENGGFHSDSGQRGQRKSFSGNATEAFAHNYPLSSDEDSEVEEIPSTSFKPRQSGFSPNASPNQQANSAQAGFGTAQANASTNSTTDSAPNFFKSKSDEGINMKFSPSDWHGKFEGNPDYFAPNMQKGTSAKGRTSPTRGRSSNRSATERSPFSNRSQPPPPPPVFTQPTQPSHIPPPPPLNTQTNFPAESASAPHSAKFTPEEWADTFKGSSWAFPIPVKDTSPRRGSMSTKRSKTAPRKPSSIPNGTPIIDLTGSTTSSNVSSSSAQPESRKGKYQTFAEDASNDNGDAMDIDSNTLPQEQSKPSTSGARTASTSPQAQRAGRARKAVNGSATAPSSAVESQATSGLDGLAGLRYVEPFAPPANGNGLSGMDEIKSSLPFQSKASSSHPTKPKRAQQLKYPIVPMRPRPPEEFTKASYDKYMESMGHYVRAFRKYSKTMIDYFSSREAELENLDPDWLKSRGETTNKLGFDSYLVGLKEDEEVMTTWKVAQEKHKEAMIECQKQRKKALRVYADE